MYLHISHVDHDFLHSYCQEYLSSLIRSDKENGTEYHETLKMYFLYDGVINDVSDVLFIHPNTLRKRLYNISKANHEMMVSFFVIKIY